MEVDGYHSGIPSKFGVLWFLIPCGLLELFSLCERLSWIVRACSSFFSGLERSLDVFCESVSLIVV